MLTTSWDLRLRALITFRDSEGRDPYFRASTPGEHRLAMWLDEQRKAARAGRLTPEHRAKLCAAGVLSEEPVEHQRTGAAWLKVDSISEFLQDEGRLPSLTSPACAGEKRLAAWMNAQLSSRAVENGPARALREILAGSQDSRDAPLARAG
ncbi:helicase associated domain-containing protein [Arthrobacter sp. L77]|uniref:helicase associated domain-containing protein n=1 Tax=Arthrobacter sp. L77 TaxID=1496689 RepID=UPI0005BA25FE|nr:helicase associated domain-containing protein [Arthrobacter sp. L77]